MAEQTEPVRRRVALKVIKLGMDTKAVVARFEAERQALAMMDHPNIAKVLDAGATETGRPYFVMELVRGIRITDYCDQNKLATRERLELFIKICQAIQHAHQKGIIHRDIKPSNILVTLHDGVPVPKVIDFGIAKATTGQQLTDKTLFTAYEQFIGTPAYMSPEQAEMSGLDIDTRSDIYSLGVLLYELLAGSTPFDANELMSHGIDAMRKTIREQEPPRPSARFATLKGDDLTTTAKRRSADTVKLMHQLKGDLDWIVMKCLEKDRTRRYETANGLAMDIKRHLNNETVVARPPSSAYRFQKLVGRNKLAFAAAGAVVCALVLGIIATTWQAVRAREAAEQAKSAEAMALQSRGEAEKLSNFMLEDFYSELEPSGQFEIVARLAREAVAYYDNLPASLHTPETDLNAAMAQARLALILAKQGDYQAMQEAASAALASFDRIREKGDHSEVAIYGTSLALFAQVYSEFAQAAYQPDRHSVIPLLERGIELLKPLATAPKGSRRIKLLYAQILDFYGHAQPPEQGVAASEEALRVLAQLGATNYSDLTAASAYADTADSEARESLGIGRVNDAQRLEQQTRTLAEGVLARRPGDLHAMADLAEAGELLAQIAEDRFHEVEALQLISEGQRAAENSVRFNPSDQYAWDSLATIHALSAEISFRLGHVAEALRKVRATIEWRPNEVSTNRYNDLSRYWISRGVPSWEAQRGDRGAAESALLEVRRYLEAYSSSQNWSRQRRALGEEDLDAIARAVKMAFGEDAEAETMARRAFERLERLKHDAPDMPVGFSRAALRLEHNALEDAARASLNLGRYAEAEEAAKELLSLPEANNSDMFYLPKQTGNRAGGQVLLAQAQAGQGRKQEALKTLEPALIQFRQRQAEGANDVLFRQWFARAFYVQSLAEPSDADGLARRRDELDEAEKLLQGLTDEARQLHDSKELLSWITAEQKKLGAP